MRILLSSLAIAVASPLLAQEPAITPTQELRTSVREWVETMRKKQVEENDWARDKEVLTNYREGLAKEIDDLTQQIADAKLRKAGADQESFQQSAERDSYTAAKHELSATIRRLEETLAAKLPLFPAPLLAEPKVSQGIEDLQRDLKLPEEKRNDGVSKRLLNVINLLTEAEKFQQTVHLRPELRKDSTGREFNMQVIYFGLACGYAVNEDGSFALAGRPSANGWIFQPRQDLTKHIQALIKSTTGDQDAAFINLPLLKP